VRRPFAAGVTTHSPPGFANCLCSTRLVGRVVRPAHVVCKNDHRDPLPELAEISVVQLSEIPSKPSARTSCSKESSRRNSAATAGAPIFGVLAVSTNATIALVTDPAATRTPRAPNWTTCPSLSPWPAVLEGNATDSAASILLRISVSEDSVALLQKKQPPRMFDVRGDEFLQR